MITGCGAGGQEPEVHPRQQDHLLHHGGGQQRQARHGPGRGLQAVLGHSGTVYSTVYRCTVQYSGGLLHLASAARLQGQTVRGEPGHHGLPGRQGAGQGCHQAHASVLKSNL